MQPGSGWGSVFCPLKVRSEDRLHPAIAPAAFVDWYRSQALEPCGRHHSAETLPGWWRNHICPSAWRARRRLPLLLPQCIGPRNPTWIRRPGRRDVGQDCETRACWDCGWDDPEESFGPLWNMRPSPNSHGAAHIQLDPGHGKRDRDGHNRHLWLCWDRNDRSRDRRPPPIPQYDPLLPCDHYRSGGLAQSGWPAAFFPRARHLP